MPENNPIYAVRLQAKVVTLNNAYTDAVAQEVIDCRSSAEAKAYARALDLGKTTHSAVLEYYVTLRDSGVFGDQVKYEQGVFVIQVEPRLILAPPVVVPEE